jgi:hypothetical protein
MNTTGGANVMGSYPYPPNGMVEIDYEHILIFKKPGKSRKIPKDIKEKSKLTKEEWKEYFYGHWYFGGARQIEHEAMFPEELPRRIIKMFTFVGETVLDPFLGSGTAVKVALDLNRNAIGYEINENFLDIIKRKIGINSLIDSGTKIEIMKRKNPAVVEKVEYVPRIKDAKPVTDPEKLNFKNDRLYKVVEILDDGSLRLNTGLVVKFRGVVIKDLDRTKKYLKEYVLKKRIYLKFDKNYVANRDFVEAYVYLKNRIFINAFLIKSGFAIADKKSNYDQKKRFIELESKDSSENLVDVGVLKKEKK